MTVDFCSALSNLPRMQDRARLFLVGCLFLVSAVATGQPAPGQDPSIDRLLSKLPPPEKLGKPPVQQALQLDDPAAKDPIVKQIVQAEQARNFQQALNLSRKLTERYPRSPVAYSLRGILALHL